MEMLAESGQLGSIEMVEINPILEPYGIKRRRLRSDFIARVLGKSIL